MFMRLLASAFSLGLLSPGIADSADDGGKPSAPPPSSSVQDVRADFHGGARVVLVDEVGEASHWVVTSQPEQAHVVTQGERSPVFVLSVDYVGRYDVRLESTVGGTTVERFFAVYADDVVAANGGILNGPRVIDGQDGRVYLYGPDGASANPPLSTTNDAPEGIAFGGDAVYVGDRVDRVIYRYDPFGRATGTSRGLRQPNGNGVGLIVGVAVAQDDLWIVDRSKRRLFRYSLSAAFDPGPTVRAQAALSLLAANAAARGLGIDDTWLYVLDETDRVVYRYRRDGTGSPETSRVLKRASGATVGAVAGARVDGFSMLVVDRGKDVVLSYDLTLLFEGTEPLPAYDEQPLASADADPRGL